MIIWNRWGFLAAIFGGVGAGIGGIIQIVLKLPSKGPAAAVCIGVGLLISSVLLYFTNKHWIEKTLDKPKPVMLTVPLQQPIQHSNGYLETHQQVPAVNPQTGQPVYTKPVSSLFFIPIKYWPYLLALIGLGVGIPNLILFLTAV